MRSGLIARHSSMTRYQAGPHLSVGRSVVWICQMESVLPKDEVRLDSEALFHDPLDVIYVPVKRTVRQHQEPRPLELPFGFQIEQSFLDGAQRHRSIHGVLGERIGFYI